MLQGRFMPTIVQTFQGRVTGLWGQASIRGADGKMHPLKLGDFIQQGDVILTTQDGIVRLSPEGSDIELAAGPSGAKKPATDEIDRVISALNDADPQAATAAGLAGGDGGGDLTPGLRVDRVNEGLTPFALLQGAGGDESARGARDPAAASDAFATDAQVPAQPPANNAPVAGDDTATTAINTPLTVTVLANDTDRDGNALTLTGATLANPAQGSVVVNPDGTLTFTPASNVSGPIAITYTVSDGQGGSASATVTVTVGANTPPSGADAGRALAEDGSYVVAIADFGFTDPDAGQTFAGVRIDSIPAAGSLLLDGVAVAAGATITAADIAAGRLTFVPAADANGAPYASFGFSVQDSAGAFDPTPNTINFSVTPINDAPIARNDLASTPINTPATIAVLGNDNDIDGDTLSVTGATLSDPSLGSVTVNPDGTLGFTPASNVSGAVVINYTIADPSGALSTATVTVSVGSNSAPAGADATATLAEDTSRTFAPSDFGYSDADAGQTFANVRIDTLPAAGALTFNGAPVVAGQLIAASDLAQLVFTPAANANGNGYASFTFSVQDSAGAFDPAPNTITFDVTPVNDTPLAQDDLASTPINTALANIAVLANDSDVDGDALTVTGAALADPALGSVTINPDGTLNFVPGTNVSGPVAINYTIADGQGGTTSAVVTVNVGANTPPAGTDALVAIAEDTSKAFSATDFGFSDADAGQSLSNVRIDTLPAAGALTFNGAPVVAGQLIAASDLAQLVFTPVADANGNGYASFTFSVQDSAGAFDPVPNTITFDVTPVADPAVISGVANGATVEDTTLVAGGKLDVADADAGEAGFQPQANLAGAHGSFSIDAAGNWTYTLNNADPAVQALGAGQTLPNEVFVVRSIDGTTANVTVTITGTNDAAVITGTAVGAVTEDATLVASGSLVAADIDSPAAFAPQTVSLTYGDFAIDAAGSWTYTLRNADANVQALTSSQHPTETIIVATADGTQQQITVAVNGANEAPTALVTPANGTEDSSGIPITLSGGDIDGTLASFTVTALPQNGTLFYAGNPVTVGTVIPAAANSATLSFVPNADWNGSTNLTFSTTDNEGANSAPVTQAITVAAVNDAPVASPDTVGGLEDSDIAVSLSGSDADGTVASISVTALPANGTLYLADGSTPVVAGSALTPAAAASLVFKPAADFNGSTSFTFTVTDDLGAVSTPATETIFVVPVNDAPTLTVPVVAAGQEDTLQPISGVSIGDVDGDSLITTLSVLNGTRSGAPSAGATILGNGGASVILIGSAAAINAALATIGYAPRADYNGNDTLRISTNDGVAPPVVADVPLTLAPVADIAADAVTTAEDTPVQIDVLANDTFESAGRTISAIDGTAITAGGPAVAVANGSVTLDATGQLLFTPTGNYNGTTSFTYTVSSAGTTETAAVSVNVTPGNDAPVALNDAFATAEDTPITFDVRGNDGDIDGDALAVTQIDGTAIAVGGSVNVTGGSVTLNADGTLTFSPALNYNGSPSFTYTVSDGTLTSTATVNGTVSPGNDAPVATPDTGALNEGATLSAAAAGGVLANDSDIDAADTKTVSGVAFGATAGTVGSVLTGTYGTLTLNADGSYSYQATQPASTALAQGQTATESFSYTMVDAAGAASTSTLTFTVTGVNSAPAGVPDTNTVSEDTPLVVAASATTGLLANDSDPDAGASLSITQFSVAGDPTTYAAGSAATIAGIGTLTINADGSYGFTPAPDYNGPVPVATYTVTDGIATTQSTLTLTVAPVADAPVLSLDFDHSHNTVAVQAISGLFNTGQSNAGTALTAGTPDPHYTLVAAPAGSTTTAAASNPAGSWVANDADSTWIGSTANQPTGIYQYQTSFTLQAGADPRSVHIAFDLSSDNNLRDILVNGVSTGFTSNLQYTQFTHVELDGGTAAFGDGVNTITFVVDNRDLGSPATSGPTGLRIDNIGGNVAVVAPDAVMHQGDYAAIYVEGTPVSIGDDDVRIQDIDSTTLQGATITLTNPQAGDVLRLSALPAGITANVNATGTTVTLSGSGTLATYEAAIRAVQFNSTSDSPSGAIDRLVSVVVTDGFANSNTATTTIHVVPVNDAPTLDLDGNNSSAAGTGYSGTFVENSFIVPIVDADLAIQDSDSATLHSATIRITNVQAGDVFSIGAMPAGITAGVYDPVAGVLTLSGTASIADYRTALGNISFANTSDNPSAVARTIEISVNDGSVNSNVAISTINVVPANDAPLANADTATATEAGGVANGIAGVNSSGNVLANDTDVDIGDTKAVSAVSGVAAGTVGGSTAGTYGSLVLNLDGSYTYSVDNSSAAVQALRNAADTLTDTFTYTVRDTAGASSSTTISFTITGANDAPVVGTSSVRVSEEGFSGANADSTGATDTTNLTTVSGSIALSDVDNAALSVTLGAPATALTSAGAAIVWQSSNGGHTLVGKAGTATIVTASIDDSGSYTVTLSGPVDHPDTSAEDVRSFGIAVNVSDGSVTSTGTLTVGIEDDSPVIGTPASAILYNGAGTVAEGDLHLKIGADSGSGAKVTFAGTSVDASGFITANRVDPSGTVVGSGFLTYKGSKLHYVSGSDGSLSAVDASNTTVYTVSGGVDSGHYSVTMLHALDPVQVTTAVFGSVSAGNNGMYSFSDGTNTFDLAATGYASNGTLSTVNTNASTFGVANNFIDGSEKLAFAISAHGSGNPSQVTGIGITAQGLGNGESLTWSAYDASHNLVGQGVVNGSGNSNSNDVAVNLTSSNFSGGSFSSIEFGGAAGTSYKLQLNSLVGNSESLHQMTNIAVHGTDSDGDPSATQAVALTFHANTTLTGTSSEGALAGGSFNDTLNGGAGNDLVIGGKGDDTLTGGTGADVFKWSLADQGTNAAKAADTVMDFDNGPTGDKLDLRDLLAGDHSDQGNLANFLHFSVTAGSTKIEISSSGGFAGGNYSAGAVDQTITLSGVDLKGSFTNDNQIINDLITRNKLVVDH